MALARDAALALGAFVALSAIAAAAGAANMGTALGIGQIGFAATVVWLMLRD
jgi:hypothetical protein